MKKKEDLPDDFLAQVKYLQGLGYRERRRVLWHRQKPRLPRYLYKFRAFDAGDSTSIERLRDILVRCRLRLSPPGELNDPFDMAVKIVVDGTQAEISERLNTLFKERGMKWETRRKEVRRIIQDLDALTLRAQTSFRDTISAAGVCSFAGNPRSPRSILMWSHYASNHRGVCLQFEIARDIATFGQALEVSYSYNYPVSNWVKEAKNITRVLLKKYIGWEYEDERRIIDPEGARQFINFRPIALSAIIVGCSASEETVQQLKDIITERTSRRLPMPKLYRAFTDEGKFRLNIKSLR